MRGCAPLLVLILLSACDPDRIYEQNTDLARARWLAGDSLQFKFSVTDPDDTVAIYCNLRNTNSYPYSRIFIRYVLEDSLHNPLKQQLISGLLFDPKTGRPTGKGRLGDVFSHQFLLLNNYKLPSQGPFLVRFEQMMRTDTLQGIISVGLRVERGAL